MGSIVTNWLVNFGSTEAAISNVAANVAALNTAMTAAAAAATEGFTKSAAAIAESNAKIKEATTASNTHKTALKTEEAGLAALQSAYKALDNAKTRANASGDAEIKKNLAAQREVKAEIDAITRAIKIETDAIDGAKAAIDREAQAQKALVATAKEASTAATAAAKAAKAAGNEGAEGGNKAGGAFSALNGIMGSATALFAGFFAVNKLKQLGSEIIDVTAEFERYEAVLTTIFDGNNAKAKRQFAVLQDFAARTPFQIGEITDAYVQLQQRGLKPTEAQLTALGDLAAASGKGFLQVSEAVLNAQVGIYRNLKQFGVTAAVDGNIVKLTFKGVTTELEKGSEALSQYLLNLGATAGIAGSTEKISATLGGRISNLKDNFTELFAVIGEGSTGPLNFFITRLSILTKQVKEYLESSDSKAIKGSAQGVADYGAIVDGIFTATAANAKKAGQDVNAALLFAFSGQEATIDTALANQEKRAQAAADFLDKKKKELSLTKMIPFGALFQGPEVAEAERLNLVELTRLKLLQQEKSELNERYQLVTKGNAKEAVTLGLILALKDKIAKLDIVRNAKGTTRDELLKSGGLNDQKDALEKELAVLEGKKDAAAKGRAEKLKAALAALQAAELALHKEYNKAIEADAKQNATALAKIQLDHDIEAIAQLKKVVIEKEKAVRAVGGRGANADGRLDAKQQAEYDKLENLARREYANKIADIERTTAARILELQRESNEKELAQLTAKFDEEIRLATKAENRLLVVALQGAKERAEALLIQTQALREIDQSQRLDANAIKRGGGEVVANLPVSDSTLTERLQAKIAAARIDAEKNMQRELLQNEVKFNKARLALIQEDGTKVTQVKRDDLTTIIQDQEKALAKLKVGTNVTGFLMNLLGVRPEDRDEVGKAFDEFANQALTQINDFANAQVNATRAVADDAQRRVDEKRSQLDTEIALRREGFASNVEGKRQELAEAKRHRAEALKDQKEAQRVQILLDAVEQSSNLITAASNIYKGASKLDAIFPGLGTGIGIALITALVGGFVATKAKAYQAVNAQTLEAGGYIGGRRHSEGGNKFVSQDGLSTVEHEAGEFVVKRRATSKYGRLLESINAEDENKMIQILFSDLLKGTGITPPARTLPQQLQQAQAMHGAATAAHSGQAVNSRIEQLSQDIAAIRANTQPQQQTTDTGSHIIYKDGNRTRIERKN